MTWEQQVQMFGKTARGREQAAHTYLGPDMSSKIAHEYIAAAILLTDS
jgi:hypothetical protein